MTRSRLAPVGALASFAVAWPAFAQPAVITGGGSITTQPGYGLEFSKFNPGSGGARKQPPATFSTYFAAGSAIGQQAFLSDNLSCDINAVTGGGSCSGGAGKRGNTVSYAASDAALGAAQISSWATSSFGQTAAGNLIQLPSMGVGVAIPVNNAAISANGELTLSDDDLCGIFSGRITDFSQITDSQTQPVPGPFRLVYHTDSEGPTFWLTNHLAAVCNPGNAAIPFTATTSFASLFPHGFPGNFFGASGSQGVASFMAGCPGSRPPPALGYVSPDYTTIDPGAAAMLNCAINGSTHSPLVAAAVLVGDTPSTPTVQNIQVGLAHPAQGTDLSPPDNAAAGADPGNWAPVVQTVKAGYPIVGYTSFNFAQCYHNPRVAKALEQFLRLHDTSPDYQTIENANGFVTLAQLAPTGFLAAIEANILANQQAWNDNIANPTACAAKSGR